MRLKLKKTSLLDAVKRPNATLEEVKEERERGRA